jgi:hypothetical protein
MPYQTARPQPSIRQNIGRQTKASGKEEKAPGELHETFGASNKA